MHSAYGTCGTCPLNRVISYLYNLAWNCAMNDYEQKLLENGFSAKDIGKLKSIIKRDESQTDSLKSLVLDLSKRFWGGVVCIAIIASVFAYGIYKGHNESLVSYGIVLIIGVIIVYFVIPLNLAWKAHCFIRKNRN